MLLEAVKATVVVARLESGGVQVGFVEELQTDKKHGLSQ